MGGKTGPSVAPPAQLSHLCSTPYLDSQKTILCHPWSIIFVLAFSYVVEYSRCKIDSTSPRTDCADCIVMLWVLPLDSAQSTDVFYPAECRATGLALFCIHLEEGG